MASSKKYSYSKMDCYKQCPFRFYLQYIKGNYAYSASLATEFGTSVHECEEAIAHYIKDGKEIDYDLLKETFNEKQAKLKEKYGDEYFLDDGKSGRNYEQKATQYLTHGIYRLEKFMKANPSYEIIGIEQRFDFPFDAEHSFNGAIDRVIHDKDSDTYLIQDIKTWPVEAKPAELKAPLQFVYYVLAAQTLWGCKSSQVRCQYDLPLCDITQDGGEPGFIDTGIGVIRDIFEKVEVKEEFKPTATPLCNWCAFCATNPDGKDEYKFLCPYHSKWRRDTRVKEDCSTKENAWTGIEHYDEVLIEHLRRHQDDIKK